MSQPLLSRSEFATWAKSLTQAQLQREIEIEKAAQENRLRTLREIQDTIFRTEQQIRDEKLKDQSGLIETRRARINELQRVIGEFNRQIATQKARISNYEAQREQAQRDYAFFNATITWQERFLPEVDKRRDALKRRASAYKGLINQEQDLLDKLIEFRASSIGELGFLNRALRGESTLQDRLVSLLGSINFWRQNERDLKATLIEEEWRINYKQALIVVGKLERITVNYYIIIDAGEHDYPRNRDAYRRKGGVKYRNKIKYPKGAFQAYLECDSFTDGGIPDQRKEPSPSLDRLMREDVIAEFNKEFKNPTRLEDGMNFKPDDLTRGIVSSRPNKEEIGKPPFKLYIERTRETGAGWIKRVEEYLMTTAEYDTFTRDMEDYRRELRRMD